MENLSKFFLSILIFFGTQFSLVASPSDTITISSSQVYQLSGMFIGEILAWSLFPNESILANTVYSESASSLDIKFKRGSVSNAAALIDETTGTRYVIINSSYVYELKDRFNNEALKQWVVCFIFAHEITHHNNNHFSNHKLSNKEKEADADETAGYLLAKMGIKLSEIETLGGIIFSDPSVGYYPSAANRASSLTEGWHRYHNQ